jgi:hypothetical protein
VPGSPLEAVMSGEVWQETYKRLVELIESHRTTLIFVNTRRLSERMAFQLSERLGAEHVAAHHGSLARLRRCARRLERARDHRVDGGIDLLDPPDATVHEFDRRKLALADQRPRRYRGQIARLGHVRITLP